MLNAVHLTTTSIIKNSSFLDIILHNKLYLVSAKFK